jgi:hypothetical protein
MAGAWDQEVVMFWREICFNVPLGTCKADEWVGKPIMHEGQQIGAIVKVVTDVEHACQRIYASLYDGVSLPAGDKWEVSSGGRP